MSSTDILHLLFFCQQPNHLPRQWVTLMSKLERDYQRKLIARIKELIPGCMVMKTNPNYIQGIPDLIILHEDFWASLEVKRSPLEPRQPNQEYYINLFHEWSYAAFIYPENEREVLNEIQHAYRRRRNARVLES